MKNITKIIFILVLTFFSVSCKKQKTEVVLAKSDKDVGVTICYNTVREPSCTMWPRSAVCINPANWRTDATDCGKTWHFARKISEKNTQIELSITIHKPKRCNHA